MDRRDFLSATSLTTLAATISEFSASVPAVALPTTGKSSPSPSFGRNSKPSVVASSYKMPSPGESVRDPAIAAIPYVFAWYDNDSKKFVNPLGFTPQLEKGNHSLQFDLHAFNVCKADQSKFDNFEKQLQLGINAKAAVINDELSWIFMNAIDVFLQKDKDGRDQALAKFSSTASKSALSLNSSPQVLVTNGTVKLQVTAFAQKKNGIWTRLFDVLSQAAKSPLISAASKGFAIPALASQAVTFVDGVLQTISAQDHLVDLWDTGALEFGVTKDIAATATFGFKPGYLAVVDNDYARKTNFLENHTIDLTYESFRIFDSNGKPIDANYLTAESKDTSKTS